MSKPYKKLNRADLQAAPIWEWFVDDGAQGGDVEAEADESHVQPTTLTEVPTGAFGQFLVAAQITLKHGEPAPGIVEVTVADGNVAVRPDVVFLLDRPLRIPGVETNRLLARFTKTLENHPVAWQLDVRIQGEAELRSGTIQGADMADFLRAGMQTLLALKSLRK